MKRTLGRSCAFKRTKHKEQDCGELCECECHKKIEWERKLLDLVDNKESGYVDFAELIRETISQREQEIAEEVKKIKTAGHEECNDDFRMNVLSILNQ